MSKGKQEESTVASDVVETETHSALSAGRELDAAVAERVMDFEEVELVGGTPYYHNVEMDRTSETGGRWRSPVPRFSTDIAAAMEVVNWMRLAAWSFACTLYEGKLPYASFCRGTAASSRHAEAETLPEAICRAALQATSEQKG